jgi:EAL and modified HD-GYP domain-containing signal transduction protein
MKYFLSSVPFFDANMAVQAYQMNTQDGNKLMGAAADFKLDGGALQTPALDTIAQTGIGPFAGDCDFFIDIGEYQLLLGMPLSMGLPSEKLVCVVSKRAVSDGMIIAKMLILKQNGYRLAIDGLPDNADIEQICSIFDYVLISIKSGNFTEALKIIHSCAGKIIPVITDIPDKQSYDKLTKIKDVLLSGDFYKQPITEGETKISPLKVNALHLLKQMNDEDFDLSAAAATIERDPALSISLLRSINSMNPNRSRKIDSIRNAVAILGQKEVKKWATIAISIGIGEDRPSEITRLSLIRAKFAENLAPAFEMAIKSGLLFISGLFSLLDVILQLPMEKAVKEVALDSEVHDALVHGKGKINDVLSLVFAYARADWNSASIIMVRNDLSVEEVTQAFIDALLWYKKLLEAIDEESTEES